MDDSLADRVSAVAALDEPTRRRLYDYVVRRPAPVSRDEAAAAVRVARGTAAFHLDRLAEEGLLDVTFERRTGRTGPGAGRTAKLYGRSPRQVDVSLPERRYGLAARLLAGALAEAERTGEPPGAILERRAYEEGRELAAAATAAGEPPGDPGTLLRILERHGFEPRGEEGGAVDVALANCPFHDLVGEHTAMVCGMNLRLLAGVLAGLDTGLTARLAPRDGCCCVRFGEG